MRIGINDSGQIVGYSNPPGDTANHAFWRRAGGTMVDLGTFGGTFSLARGLNNAGQVVGYSYVTGDTTYRATIWSGPWKDLVGNFGRSYGIWARRQTAWIQPHSWSPEAIVSGDFDGNGLDDLAIDFSPNSGVWLWMNHATWVPLHDQSPTAMTVGDLDHNGKSDLVLSFPGYGLWAWMNNSTWRTLNAHRGDRA